MFRGVEQLQTLCLLLFMLVLSSVKTWGQPSEGLYFIANYNNKGYPTETTANHYYLVPAADPKQSYYIDAYYSANFGSENGDPNQPFLTTYKTNKDANSVWRVENVPGETGFYYIIHQQTGRYVIYEPVFSSANSRRKCMHLKTTTTPGNEAKFEITVSETGYAIRPKLVASGNCYFNIASANTNDYYSTGPTSGSPTYFNGLVGLYTDPKDKNGVWFFEKATIDPPTITNNETVTNTFTIAAETGATIYYTTDGTTPTTSDYTETGTTPVNVDQTGGMTVIKAIAKGTSDHFPTIVTTYNIPACERPVISVSGGTVTITCPKAGAAIHYTTNGDPATASSTPYNGPFAKGDATTIRAVATKAGYLISSEAIYLPPTEVSSSDEMTDMNGNYLLTSSFTSSGSIGTSANPFKGTIDGNLNSLTLSCPLVAYADGAIIKNVILDNKNVTISGNENGNAGAICCEATGDTRIYNCGVLGGSVEGSNNVGGIVGLLDGRARVINCYNYAKITNGSNCGGIVGYNNVASTSGNLQTMVMNCMFYGDITGGNAAPIYGGKNIHNKYVSADDTGLNNYCYFLYDEEKNPYVKTIATGNYHGALGAEERYLNRFEFFRMTLNSTRNLAAYYVTGDATQNGEIAKWVLDKSIAPYPILKVQDKYPSVVNPDAAHATTQTDRNKGGLLGTLSVTISGPGSGAVFGAPTGASITTHSKTLNITDKDYDNFNFNYRKVQLPYYNEVGTGNYTKASDGTGRVVTGWKITSITGGTAGEFTTGVDAPAYNFVDRKCTNKDLYSVSGRVFAQGAYWEVPDGVTAITIEPYWAKAVYLSDANYDVTYTITFSGSGSSMTATATKYGVTVCGSSPTDCNGQTVYTDLSTAMTNLGSNASVYDYAVVLVGNYHQAANDALVNNGLPVTFMSADLDGDNEPDNTLFYYHNMRKSVSSVRFDFLNIPGIGMVKRTHDATMDPEPGIFCPKGWFEVTNTVFIRFGQFEYAGSSSSATGTPAWPKTSLAPLILQGGIYEQFVSCCRTDAQNTNYLLIGGNAWFKNFANGCHTANANKTPKVPINVAGGDFTNFYLTGIYQPASNEPSENAECYIDGGRFTEVAGAGMQQVKGNITWLINAADITSFFGGGINAAKPLTGSISTTISNSYVDEFYGGPKFGDMSENKTVTTTATDCHFGKFFGAGYGGTAFNKVLPTPTTTYDSSSKENTRSWDSWVNAEYKRAYSAGNGGISTNYDYEFMLHSDGNQTVARFYVNYASLSLATTRNVTSTLSGCTIGTFYGGGSLGAVNGDVKSTLTNCTVTGNAFGAGFSASVPTVEVWNANSYLVPQPTYNRTANVFNNSSVKTPKDNNQYVEYTWSNSYGSNSNPFVDTEDGKHYIHTEVSLDGLGTVTGKVTLTIEGTTEVKGSVYGGGEESNVAGNTRVNISGGTIAQNVYGGGNIGSVSGSVAVNMIDGTVQKDVYGGGALADTQTSNWDAASNSGAGGWAIGKTSASATTTVRLTGGTIQGNAYGGGLGEEGKPAYVYGDVLLDLNGTTSSGETGTAIAIDSKGCVVNQVFGCNNVNGTPMGNVLVHVYATQNKNKSQIGNTDGETPVTDAKVIGSYDVKAVYGGGNLAAYKPAGGKNTTNSTNVIIDGCGLTSIQTVYGGGNAASTPATKVTVNGTFEIEELFGGGNGKDAIGKDTQGNDIPNPGANVGFYDYSAVESTYDTKEKRQQDDFVNYYVYGTGKASVNVFGGTIHRVFGGSNTKGNVRQTAVTLLDDVEGCIFCVDEAYGGGKSAPMDAEAKLLMSCIPGLNVAYGGAEAADIQGNVILNITNGKFDRVFGGNNKSGTIRGSITVNIEETGCKPIIIGELYGGGNLAGYSIYGYKEVIEDNKKVWKPRESESDEGTGPIHNYADPQINVKSFTSIGDIYGGGLGESALMVGSPTVNINVANGKFYNNDDAVVAEGTKTPGNYPIPSHAKGKIGAINNVFGGGNAAKVIGNTNVDIGTQSEVYMIKSVAVGDPVTDYFIRNFDGTYSAATGTAVEGTTYYEKKDVIGADIRGNVYGGGNNAEVTGNTNVQIGKKATE